MPWWDAFSLFDRMAGVNPNRYKRRKGVVSMWEIRNVGGRECERIPVYVEVEETEDLGEFSRVQVLSVSGGTYTVPEAAYKLGHIVPKEKISWAGGQ